MPKNIISTLIIILLLAAAISGCSLFKNPKNIPAEIIQPAKNQAMKQPASNQPATTLNTNTNTNLNNQNAPLTNQNIPATNQKLVQQQPAVTFFNPLGLTGQKLDIINKMGAGWSRQAVAWGWVEPKDNQFDWTRTDQIYNDLKAHDLQALFVLLNRENNWAHKKPKDIKTSMPPSDLGNQWTEEYGYSKTYYDFIYQFVNRYGDRFNIIVIENEANAPNFWGGTADEYIRQLKTAYLAAHRAKPNIIVADSGIASGAWGFTVAKDLLNKKQDAEALQFYNDYYQNITNQQFPRLTSVSELQKYLAKPAIATMADNILKILSQERGAIDAINFHFYENDKILPDFIVWLKEKIGDQNLSLICNEAGTRSNDQNYKNSQEFADNVIKNLTVLLANNVSPIIWYWWDGENGAAGLMNPDQSLRPGGQAFQYLAKKINSGLKFTDHATINNVERYRFKNTKTGQYAFEILWNDSSAKEISLDLPVNIQQVKVENYQGISQPKNGQNNKIELKITNQPLFISY